MWWRGRRNWSRRMMNSKWREEERTTKSETDLWLTAEDCSGGIVFSAAEISVRSRGRWAGPPAAGSGPGWAGWTQSCRCYCESDLLKGQTDREVKGGGEGRKATVKPRKGEQKRREGEKHTRVSETARKSREKASRLSQEVSRFRNRVKKTWCELMMWCATK